MKWYCSKDVKILSYLVIIHYTEEDSSSISYDIVHVRCEVDYTNMVVKYKELVRRRNVWLNIMLLPSFPNVNMSPVWYMSPIENRYLGGTDNVRQ